MKPILTFKRVTIARFKKSEQVKRALPPVVLLLHYLVVIIFFFFTLLLLYYYIIIIQLKLYRVSSSKITISIYCTHPVNHNEIEICLKCV